jgi:hypothetical protein
LFSLSWKWKIRRTTLILCWLCIIWLCIVRGGYYPQWGSKWWTLLRRSLGNKSQKTDHNCVNRLGQA